MKKIYTLIKFVPDEQGWHDRCGNYNHGTKAECEIDYYDDKLMASEALGRAFFMNKDGENTFLINGMNPDLLYLYDFLSKEDKSDLEKEWDEIMNLAWNKESLLVVEREKMLKEEKERKLLEETLKKEKEKKRIEDLERKQLELLLSKYGNNGGIK